MSDDTEERHEQHPKIDVSKALGEAGHEVKDLGYEGVADTAPLRHEDEAEHHALEEIARDLGTHTSD